METIVDRLFLHAQATPNKPAMWYKRGSTWKHFTWGKYWERVQDFAGALLDLNYLPGDAISIMGNNCPEWVIADVAAMSIRAVPAGIYQTCTPDQASYIANHSESRVLVIEDVEIWNHLDLNNNLELFETVELIVAIRDADKIGHEKVVSFDAFCERGKKHHEDVLSRLKACEPDDLATLIYTSGTTGPPKGVMLSHDNLAWTARQATDVVGDMKSDEDCIVSYLPLSHIAEQMFSIHLPITAGVPIWFAESILKLKDALIIARPGLFLGVPRVWEKFKSALETRLEDATGVKAKIVKFSRATLLECGHIIVREGIEGLSLTQRARYEVANRLFAQNLKRAIGFDRLQLAITSAAPISYEVLEFFLSCGIILHEAYGQSEDNGPTTINAPFPGQRKLGAAGLPFPGCEVKIAEDGEILVRGRNVFLGYYKNDDATDEALQDGWLHSGDIGEIDDDGFLFITDRKKDIIITAGGKNVAPQNIEKLMRGIDGISQTVVIGDQRKYLVALMTLDPERAPEIAQERGWPQALDDLAEHDAFLQYVDDHVAKRNDALAKYETIKKFGLLSEDFSVESGELTPTQKVKRNVVSERYAPLIDEMYAE